MELNKSILNQREDFLSNLSESQVSGFRTLFNKAKRVEDLYNRPIEYFNEEEFYKFISEYLYSKTVNALSTKVCLLRKYYKHIGNTAADGITREKITTIVENYVGTNEAKSKYVDWNEVKGKMSRLLDSNIDKALVCLIRLGVKDENSYDNIRFLKVKDINFATNEMRIGNKIIKFDDYMRDIFIAAKNERVIEVQSIDDRIIRYELNPGNPYLIKPKGSVANNYGLDAYSRVGFTHKIYPVFEKIDVNIVNLIQSTVAEQVIEYEKEKNLELTRRELYVYLKTLDIKVDELDIYNIVKYLKEKDKVGNI